MKKTRMIQLLLGLMALVYSACTGQPSSMVTPLEKNKVGGPFENGEWVYQRQPPAMSSVDTSAGWHQNGQKILITGVVRQKNGNIPASNVVVYYYHTNVDGRYIHQPEIARSMPPNEKGQTHGYIRGWVKTDSSGRYFIYTVKPGAYPNRPTPQHIHLTVKEPNSFNEYYIDDVVFDDDPLLKTALRNKMECRGGSGVVRLVAHKGLLVGERDIYLGSNIPDYPSEKMSDTPVSGKEVGEDVASFMPFHAWGRDKGSKACPICRYGWFHGVLYFVEQNPDWNEVKKWLNLLEKESAKRGQYLKVYMVYEKAPNQSPEAVTALLERIGEELQLEQVALTFVPGFSDMTSGVALNKINPTVDNTIVLYKRSRIIGKFVNLTPDSVNFSRINAVLDASINEYFFLPSSF